MDSLLGTIHDGKSSDFEKPKPKLIKQEHRKTVGLGAEWINAGNCQRVMIALGESRIRIAVQSVHPKQARWVRRERLEMVKTQSTKQTGYQAHGDAAKNM